MIKPELWDPALSTAYFLTQGQFHLRRSCSGQTVRAGTIPFLRKAVHAVLHVAVGGNPKALPNALKARVMLPDGVKVSNGFWNGIRFRHPVLIFLRRRYEMLSFLFARRSSPRGTDQLLRVAIEALPNGCRDTMRMKSDFDLLRERGSQASCTTNDFRRMSPNDDGCSEFVARSTRFGVFHALVVAPRPDDPKYPFHVSGCHRASFPQKRGAA